MRPGPESLSLYVVFDHPSDYPDWWVIVRQAVLRPVPPATERIVTRGRWLSPTLEAAREMIQRVNPGATCLGRDPGDDPVIHEVWI